MSPETPARKVADAGGVTSRLGISHQFDDPAMSNTKRLEYRRGPGDGQWTAVSRQLSKVVWRLCQSALVSKDHGLHAVPQSPGTSKWNTIEHRLFSHISMNWRGRPLTSHEVIVNTIASTTTRTGLKVHAELDTHQNPTE